MSESFESGPHWSIGTYTVYHAGDVPFAHELGGYCEGDYIHAIL